MLHIKYPLLMVLKNLMIFLNFVIIKREIKKLDS